MSFNESLDHQMTYGKDYVNLPEHLFPTDKAPLYTGIQLNFDIVNIFIDFFYVSGY